MALVTDPGGTGSDSYASLTEADVYFYTRLFTGDWTDAETADKEKSLKWATRLLDERVQWNGSIASNAQALRWPRTGVVDQDGRTVSHTSIPDFLINATSEFAIRLLETDLSADREGMGLDRVMVDKMRIYYDKADRPGVIPEYVRDMIRHYGKPLDDRAAMMQLERGRKQRDVRV